MIANAGISMWIVMIRRLSAYRFVEPRLKKIQQRVLCLASQGDWLLPSEDEGQRLKRKLPRLRLKASAISVRKPLPYRSQL